MNKKIGLFAGLTALFAMGSAHAEAVCPTISQVGTAINDETGHTFFLYAAPAITWDQAQACLPGLGLQSGVSAHLATITSSSENAWIVSQLLGPAVAASSLTSSQVWVGGFQETGAAEPGEGWRWVNNEGQIPVPGTSVTLGYSNWDLAEPNDTGGPSVNERHLTLGRYSDLGRWNDEGAAPSNIGGFIVEYDTPRTVGGGCTATGSTTACETVKGQTLTFPPGTVINTDNGFTFTAYEFTDPRVDGSGRCVGINNVRGPLTLFEGPEFNVPGPNNTSVSGKLVIPAYLCGSPKFIVVRALPFGAGISIPEGVVITESNTRTIPNVSNPTDPPLPGILPGNFFDCKAPIPAGGSPQQQDVGVWQSLDGTEMWESAPTSPVARFAGTAAELTTGCGSTLIKTRTKSNFVVGLHLDFGAGVAPGSAAEYNEMVALTQYKMSLLQQSVIEANSKNKIGKPNGQAALSQLNNAIARLAANDPVGARKKMEDFLKKVNQSTYVTNPQDPLEFNYNGDHLSRGENILFTLNHKVIPFKPVP
jgi:hypothetical protein